MAGTNITSGRAAADLASEGMSMIEGLLSKVASWRPTTEQAILGSVAVVGGVALAAIARGCGLECSTPIGSLKINPAPERRAA